MIMRDTILFKKYVRNYIYRETINENVQEQANKRT